ncbi:MAG: aminodeoxychorismate/anthranilate synthase component II [Cytophagaceae bacterium]|jgi:anthranilate synthase component 2|nr:aminodeoxychorismate/anthranilate synthase component II [Cytophagaceae bacterium]
MAEKILMIDNYDSFTYNLVHIVKKFGFHIDVFRNDKISLEEVGQYQKIMLSPGPGIPSEAGILQEVVKRYASSKDIFGVCLGHQCIGEIFGGTLTNIEKVYHGIATPIQILKDDLLFDGLPKEFKVGRYHSWVVDEKGFPSEVLDVTATDALGRVMALRHKQYKVCGVQFHPESILTEHGERMMQNWLQS